MTGQNRYGVEIRHARIGYVSEVSKQTLMAGNDDYEPWWMGRSPRPTYWRPTYGWALGRARRKRRALERADARLATRRRVVEKLVR